MHRSVRGFTLIEVLSVVAILAVLAAIGIPNLVPARIAANETAAMATLRTLSTAQAQFRQRALVDADADGGGEYGSFTELSGAAAGRMAVPLVPTHLSGVFRSLSADGAGRGAVNRNGYWYRIWLPAATRDGTCEDAAGLFVTPADAKLSATVWCAYAWPASYQQSGNRTFFVNQAGDVLATEVGTYDGLANGPAADAAFATPADIVGHADLGGSGQLPVGTAAWRQAH